MYARLIVTSVVRRHGRFCCQINCWSLARHNLRSEERSLPLLRALVTLCRNLRADQCSGTLLCVVFRNSVRRLLNQDEASVVLERAWPYTKSRNGLPM